MRYEIAGKLAEPIACHCSQCTRTSGNFAAMAACRSEDIRLIASSTLTWYRSSPNVERGFLFALRRQSFLEGSAHTTSLRHDAAVPIDDCSRLRKQSLVLRAASAQSPSKSPSPPLRRRALRSSKSHIKRQAAHDVEDGVFPE
ncbi:hypothetical protein [Mesorhizobium sp.]|uniref:GFA family protein n=1 Tax=Mesorhizobium sp. TaxID=1871066 RepID=UPI0025BE125C|nr:hypothetical protein [Mesorhizobium sp.]